MNDELRSGGEGVILALIGWVWQHKVEYMYMCVMIIHSSGWRASCWDRGLRAEGEQKRHKGRLAVSQAEKQT